MTPHWFVWWSPHRKYLTFLKILFNPRKQYNKEIIAIFGVISLYTFKHFAKKDLDTSPYKFLLKPRPLASDF